MNDLLLPTLVISVMISVGCTRAKTDQDSSTRNTVIETVDAAKVDQQATSSRPAYLGAWRLDVEAYAQSKAFQNLDMQKREAVMKMLSTAKSEFIVSEGLIHKTGQFGAKTVTAKTPYTVREKKGEVWMVDVMTDGVTQSQEWRMSGERLVIRIEGKDRVFRPVEPSPKPKKDTDKSPPP
ncbi:MAG: hypothetical protein VX589_12260 [Myxococcota bacterium]|nr:hypothetical protein [Myxococcota bacterium]